MVSCFLCPSCFSWEISWLWASASACSFLLCPAHLSASSSAPLLLSVVTQEIRAELTSSLFLWVENVGLSPVSWFCRLMFSSFSSLTESRPWM